MTLFEQACGVGVIISDNDIRNAVNTVINEHKKELVESRYEYPINRLLFSVKEGPMKWADGRKVKEIFDESILQLLGERTEDDQRVGVMIMIDYIESSREEKEEETETDCCRWF